MHVDQICSPGASWLAGLLAGESIKESIVGKRIMDTYQKLLYCITGVKANQKKMYICFAR